jgi:hypothetical protein
MDERYRELLGTAILGIDTLWGGDVMCPSGTGRFIADSWFSDEPLPVAYTDPAAARLREAGGVSAKQPDREAIQGYLAVVDIPAALEGLRREAQAFGGLRGEYVTGLAECLEIMWDLAMEIVRKGQPVPYERCVLASTGRSPSRSDPQSKRERVEQLLGKVGAASVDEWRRRHLIPMASIGALGAAVISYFDQLSGRHVAPYLLQPLPAVPRANIQFLPIEDAWFSGSMNYLGRARRADGSPEYEATYQINASLEISVPEFLQLVSHEVVPGHVTTFAYLQNLYWRGLIGFEASVLTMNTRAAALFEGIANNAILMAHGVTEVDALADPDLQIGVLLALLQDDAKNHASYLTWEERLPRPVVAHALRKEFLVSQERADKLAGAWARHPLLGRMYLPAYRAGTEKVAELRRRLPDAKAIPLLYGCSGLVDITTIEKALAMNSGALQSK